MIPSPAKHIKDFEKLGFGMFIHWGLYSQLGIGEWAKLLRNIPMDEYKKLKDTFTAQDYYPREIVKMAKSSGMKYIVLTTRHHEGFSLYDTCGLNDFDAPNSPAGRDLIREYVDACNDEGIVPFFYHTTLDWYESTFETDFKAYQKYLRRSVEILCTKYGKIGGLWFDGNWSKPNADWEEDELYTLIRKHQPDAIIINNTGINAKGESGHKEIDSVTFEQGRPNAMNREGHEKYIAAEMCETLNCHWGIGYNDFNYKSPAQIIENLCSCRKVGANYLLNIGPTAQGGINSIDNAIFEIVGRWVDLYGEAIYSTKPSEIYGLNKDFVLQADESTAYLFVHNLPISGDNNVTIFQDGAGIRSFYNVDKNVASIQWLDNNEELKHKYFENDNILAVNTTPYNYGNNMIVRVAKVSFC